MLFSVVEQRIEPGSADYSDIGQHCHAQTLTARLDASYGARHGVDRDLGDGRLRWPGRCRRVGSCRGTG
jgi:hypothetical protein